jgi:hypothetical protein
MIKLLDILNEIGEANVKPFNWAKTSGTDAKQFKERMGSKNWRDIGYDIVNTYEFTTDKGTVYVVDIMIESVYNEESYSKFDSGTIEASIDFATKDSIGIAHYRGTNKHEQYAVMSTITDIFTTWVNEWDEELYITKITIDPIKDEDDDSYGDRTDNQRGRLYHAFMKKQLSKLNKQYHVRVFDNHFEISPTFTNPNDPSYD